MTGPAGFWSYVHDDDEAEGGRILKLASKLRDAYALVTALDLELFIDRTDLQWGDAWRQRIDNAVAGTTFFIPVITPRYFRSEECRRELLAFWAEAQRSNLTQLLLPIYYVDVPELEHDPSDEAMSLVASRQWVDFREVRLEAEDSPAYRRELDGLAKRIAEIARDVGNIPDETPSATETRVTVSNRSITSDKEEADEQPDPGGALEQLAEMEGLLPHISTILDQVSQEVQRTGDAAETSARAIERSDAQGRGFAGRLAVTQRLAAELEEPTSNIQRLGEDYLRSLVNADPGVLTLMSLMEDALSQHVEGADAEVESVDEFTAAVQGASTAAEEGKAALEEMLQLWQQMLRYSRSMQRPYAAVKSGVTAISDGLSIIQKWSTRAAELRTRAGLDPSS